MTMSAGMLGAFSKKRSLDPGTERQERRGRLRERSVTTAMVRLAPRRHDPSETAVPESSRAAVLVGSFASEDRCRRSARCPAPGQDGDEVGEK